MNPAWWSVVIAALVALGAWLSFIAKLLWTFRGQWDETNVRLGDLASRDQLIEQKLDLHIAWHERDCQNWGARPAAQQRGRGR